MGRRWLHISQGERPETDPPLTALWRNQLCQRLDFELPVSRTLRRSISAEATQVVLLCQSSPQKLTTRWGTSAFPNGFQITWRMTADQSIVAALLETLLQKPRLGREELENNKLSPDYLAIHETLNKTWLHSGVLHSLFFLFSQIDKPDSLLNSHLWEHKLLHLRSLPQSWRGRGAAFENVFL